MSNIARTYKKELTRGESLNLFFDWKESVDGLQLELGTYTGKAFFYSTGNPTPVEFPLVLNSLPADRNISLSLTPAQTATLNVGVNELRLKLTDSGGGIHMLPDKGSVKILVKTNDPVNV